MSELYKSSIKKRFDHLLKVMENQQFLNMQGLGNEVPFFIFPYQPQEETEIAKMCSDLQQKLSMVGVNVLTINVYDTAVGLLQKGGSWDLYLKEEPGFTKKELLEDLQNSLSAETHMIPAIVDKVDSAGKFDILFLTGVGQVFPFIRSHTILNNLQSKAKDFPTVMWFPGEYKHSDDTGSSLDLFGLLHDDKYYRAFNILDYQI